MKAEHFDGFYYFNKLLCLKYAVEIRYNEMTDSEWSYRVNNLCFCKLVETKLMTLKLKKKILQQKFEHLKQSAQDLVGRTK